MPKVSAARPAPRAPKLGQHFLADPSAAMRIAEAFGDLSQSTVLEIGAGRGALTSLLARRARRLIAIELDRVLAAQLRMKFSLTPNVEIIEGDILAIDFDTLFGPKPGSTRPGMNHQPEPARVVGNLPYFITSDILLRLFAYRRYFETIVLMVQREVGDRLAARPGTSEYGLLSATAQLYAQRRENVYSSSGGVFAAAQGALDRCQAYHRFSHRGLRRAGDRLHRLPEKIVWTEAEDAVEQFEGRLSGRSFARSPGKIRCETNRASRGYYRWKRVRGYFALCLTPQSS